MGNTRKGKETEEMKVAVMGDVHANLAALEAVLRDARERGAERFWCAGDVVGYGTD